MNSSFNYAKTLGGGSYSGLKQAILRPETGGILFTDDQLINEWVQMSCSGVAFENVKVCFNINFAYTV